MNTLDLFSGIGGFSLGLERAGFKTVAFCEIEPFPRAVLARHWPEVPIYEDVRTLTGARLATDGIVPDVICGGFPCQDISLAGRGGGLSGARSGLWSDYARLIGEIRPQWVIIENVPALRSRGLDTVLGEIAALGYDAEWHCVPAAAVGAPHRRDRVWIVAYPNDRQGRRIEPQRGADKRNSDAGGYGAQGDVAYAEQRTGIIRHEFAVQRGRADHAEQTRLGSGDVADSYDGGPQDRHGAPIRPRLWPIKLKRCSGEKLGDVAYPDSGGWRVQGHVGEAPGGTRPGQFGVGGAGLADAGAGLSASERGPLLGTGWRDERRATAERGGGCPESRLGRIVDGLSEGVDSPWGAGWEDGTARVATTAADKVDRRKRLIALGNAVVPQIPELIGRAIMRAAGLAA